MGTVVEDLVGLSAAKSLEVVLSSLDDLQEIRIAKLYPLPPLQRRLKLTPAESTVFERALELRKQTGLPFWDAAILQLLSYPNAIELLDAAMAHVSLRGKERTMSFAELASGALERACSRFPVDGESSLTFLSEVLRKDGTIAHVPMLDFHAFKSPANLRIVEVIAQRLLPEGSILLDSGESYHLYGTKLLSEENFRLFLARALLFAPIVDRAYVAHQLIEGRCALRLSPGGGKITVPVVVAAFSGK